jgi:hypothetical protein
LIKKEAFPSMNWTGIAGLVAYGAVTAVPVVIASRRRCKDIVLIYLLSSYLSWTIVGWVAAVIWAVKGQTEIPPGK